jgi:hypothetical protein
VIDIIIFSVCTTLGLALIAYQVYKRLLADWHHFKLSLEDRRLTTEREMLDIDRLKREMAFSQIDSPTGHTIIYDHRSQRYIEFEKSVAFAPPQNEQDVQTEDNLQPALPMLMPVQRLMVAGGQNTGKTSLLQWLTSERLKTGSRVIIIDSHCFPGKWPGHAEIIGKNRDYQAIETAFVNLLKLMDDRYREYSSGQVGERRHPHITLVIDEFSMIAKNAENTKDFITTALMEFRKVNLDMILAGQSTRAGNMGLRGSYDLFESFDCLCHLKMENGYRKAYLNFGDGNELETVHPGPYHGMSKHSHTDSYYDHDFSGHTYSDPGQTRENTGNHARSQKTSRSGHGLLCESPRDYIVTALYRIGKSISAISETVFGGRNAKRNQTIKDTLKRYKMS